MVEALEIQIARLQEQTKIIATALSEDRELRKESEKQLVEIITSLKTVDRRLEIVESQLTKNSLVIEEFVTIKHRVQGVGMVGKWVWLAGGFLISTLYASREAVRNFFLG